MMDILDLEEKLHKDISEGNEQELSNIMLEFKRKHYPNVLTKIKAYRNSYQVNVSLSTTLAIMEAVSHAEIEEFKQASDIILSLFNQQTNQNSKDLLLLGELAYMCDYRLSRKILSAAKKKLENEDWITKARIYLMLGESEEQLEKYVRAVKYYKNGLQYFSLHNNYDHYLVLYLNFKIGMLYSWMEEAKDAIHYLEKTLELMENNSEHQEIKIKSLIAIAKMYSKEGKNSISILRKALDLMNHSSLHKTYTHADALVELGFTYFNQSQYGLAIPYYEEAVKMYEELPRTSNRLLGMVSMQYSYCLEHQQDPQLSRASKQYEQSIMYLERSNDRELLENALGDVINFFDRKNNDRKKRFYENKFVQLQNQAQRNA